MLRTVSSSSMLPAPNTGPLWGSCHHAGDPGAGLAAAPTTNGSCDSTPLARLAGTVNSWRPSMAAVAVSFFHQGRQGVIQLIVLVCLDDNYAG